MSNRILMFIAALLIVFPLLVVRNTEFAGADVLAEEMIQQIAPNYEPWFDVFFEPPGGEVETLLFSLQAAFGAGIIGYIIGLYKGRKRNG
ncbi:energy-coupling factor ABC transporter substrate-binding protein [Anoxybacillus flavithermus]|uniref:Cobalt transport protein CbiN n=1 Tax=Anoxybacillus flavithermus TaxID=33934 RepID=A0A2G5RSV4_9BACL|nr:MULTISPECIES: energy-coupling factor ABC transporter substrate-binding protein [Anoxybacillus]KFZ43801.1 cobalamin biosynthesis protein CbiN [Anoxybacillus sp. KU2-6(11)]PIC05894.1 energy-coupling factor ABC transporter substrate-binding protein [Anoxybacillus flavithermus]